MNVKSRRQFILEQLDLHEKIEIEELAVQLEVSTMTIRRDLSLLEQKNELIRTPRGATRNHQIIYESSFQHKENKNIELKQDIAKRAVSLIREHTTVILDSGTTTLEIAKLMTNHKNVTVITNDIYIATILINSEVKVILLGGELQNNVGAIFGSQTEQMLRQLYVDMCFMGTHALHPIAGMTTTSFEKAGVKRAMIRAAKKTYIVADHSKLNERAMVKVCDLDEINGGLITNCEKQQLQGFSEKIKIIE